MNAGRFSEWFWNPDVWLPPNITWTDLKDTEDVKYAKFVDVYYAFPMAVFFSILRIALERFVYVPFGMTLGLKVSKPKKIPINELLETAFKANGRIDYKQIQGLAKKLQWSDRQVERWFRLRKQTNKPNTLIKFAESSWRFSYYLGILVYGVVYLWDKPWLWESSHCWYGYPHHTTDLGTWWYYQFQMGFYLSLLVFQFFDAKRKDFWQMFVHHIVTLVLLTFSWACNMTRVGTLVMIIHDCADVPLEAAKMAKYVNKQRLCDAIFGFFTLTWFVTRLGLYPYKVVYSSLVTAPLLIGKVKYPTVWSSLRVVYSTLFEAPTILPMFSAYYIFNSLLICLQLLHVLWSFMILRVTVTAVASGKIEKDVRSDSESSGRGSDAENDKTNVGETLASRNSITPIHHV
ncbi:hypothetical protein CHUAL_007429 [Chamberlinius hualienensis]